MGKNLYVQNPFAEGNLSFCTEAVYVNGRLVLENPITSAFEIHLEFLPLGSPLEIKIVHKPGCAPEIVNIQEIDNDNQFRFLTLDIDEDVVKWITEKETASGTYVIERLEGEEWVEVAQIAAQGKDANNFYKLPAIHSQGINTYRIKLTQPEGLTLYSREIAYHNTKN